MASFKYDKKHLSPNPSPEKGRIEGRVLPGPGETGVFTVVFLDESGNEVSEGTATSNDGAPVPLDCAHTLQLDRVTQVNLSDRVTPGSGGMLRPVWLR